MKRVRKWSYERRLAAAMMVNGIVHSGFGILLGSYIDFLHYILQGTFEPLLAIFCGILFFAYGSLTFWDKYRKETTTK